MSMSMYTMPRFGPLLFLAVMMVCVLSSLTADAFMPAIVLPPSHRPAHLSVGAVLQQQSTKEGSLTTGRSSCLLEMAGFGSGGGGTKKGGAGKSKKSSNKLKPKAQWDRYKNDLKKEEAVRVAVRQRIGGAKWYQVGAVKSKDSAYTEAAVLRHKVLIAEHARRMFPGQISSSPKDRLEWAYCSSTATQDDDWIVLDDSTAVAPSEEDIEKLSGFEGLADSTGLYARRTVKKVDVT